MTDVYTTVVGFVGTDVDYHQGNGTAARATFRLASTPRYFDSTQGAWREQETVWFSVKVWRGLASNVASSIRKGEPVIVYGRVRNHSWRDEHDEERSRQELEAVAVGHDLTRGTSAYLRRQTPAATEHQQRSPEADTQVHPQPTAERAAWPGPVSDGQRPTAPREVVTT